MQISEAFAGILGRCEEGVKDFWLEQPLSFAVTATKQGIFCDFFDELDEFCDSVGIEGENDRRCLKGSAKGRRRWEFLGDRHGRLDELAFIF